MAFLVVTLLIAILAISYIGRHHFSEGCVAAYWLIAAVLGIAAAIKIVMESEKQ
jgi:hypothetical protein